MAKHGLATRRRQPPRENAVESLIDELKHSHPAEVTASFRQSERPAAYADFPAALDLRLVRALHERGIKQLYSHQRAAWDAIDAGSSTVVATPTASGKSLCYNLPVLQAVVQTQAKALYLFPTKALSQDQVAELTELNQAANLGVRAFTFDGDTPGDARKAVRTKGDIVVSNPDMLHQGILPHHTKWAQFFESLRYVVIDELHVYRGVFGSHMANLLRRLRRITDFYRVQPRYVMCSATIANPGELASQLIEAEVATISESGAPRGGKHLLLWNPPVVNHDLGIRASARSQTAKITRQAVAANLKSIVFANTRIQVEVLTKYLKDAFDKDPRFRPRIRAYRGGYLPTERRSTERELRGGEVDCVVTTSALELGVDIGALDVCVLNGYPGSIAATWQRLGRAGRRNRTSLGILVATSMPLDQYMVRNPQFFIDASPEHARIDANQLLILLDHLRCAAFELPFNDGERFGTADVAELLAYLEDEQLIHHEAGRWHWMADSYPANAVSLRTVTEGNFVVIDVTKGKQDVIAEVDYAGASSTLYEGAIYMIQAKPWQVERLDWEGRKAFVKETDADYYTEAIEYTRLKVLEQFQQSAAAAAVNAHGEVHLVRRIPGYKKIRFYTHENVGYGHVRLPDQEMHTTAAWWQAEPRALEAEFATRWQALDGFLGAGYALHHVAALLTLSELRDLGHAIGNSDGKWFSTVGRAGVGEVKDEQGNAVDVDGTEHSFQPTLYLYDNYPGGIGLSAPLFDRAADVVAHAMALVQNCSCSHGCPACVGPILSTDERTASSVKDAAVKVLSLLHTGPGRG